MGSDASEYFGKLGNDVVGIDNDMRGAFFGAEASTKWNVARLRETLGSSYRHCEMDIRDRSALLKLFGNYGRDIRIIVHAAAQPSHDWAAKEPFTDFDINAVGTLNLLEATRRHAPEAPFIFVSTNKVYGDRPNGLPLVELNTRYEVDESHIYYGGVREDMAIDCALHSVFGASKVAADIMVQEYGRYFGLLTVCFRGGTLTGPLHSAAQLHGFLGYVMRCAMSGKHYKVFGYKGKQVRDVIHSSDLIKAFDEFVKKPRPAEVYNIGGGRLNNCSVLEAIRLSEEVAGRELNWSYEPTHRIGDHIWWIGDNGKFESHYPQWQQQHDLNGILREIHEFNRNTWVPERT